MHARQVDDSSDGTKVRAGPFEDPHVDSLVGTNGTSGEAQGGEQLLLAAWSHAGE